MELRERNRRVSGQYLLAREYRRLHGISATDDSTVRLHIISFLAKSDVCRDHVAKEFSTHRNFFSQGEGSFGGQHSGILILFCFSSKFSCFQNYFQLLTKLQTDNILEDSYGDFQYHSRTNEASGCNVSLFEYRSIEEIRVEIEAKEARSGAEFV
jgi:hypothetical protein